MWDSIEAKIFQIYNDLRKTKYRSKHQILMFLCTMGHPVPVLFLLRRSGCKENIRPPRNLKIKCDVYLDSVNMAFRKKTAWKQICSNLYHDVFNFL